MRLRTTGALCAIVTLFTAGAATAVLPIRKPEVHAPVVKVVPATEVEKQKGVLVTVFLKDRKDGVPVTKETSVHKQMGKLVPIVEAGDIKEGQKASVWIDAKTGTAEGVLIFP
jgi:hypothetical protein